MFFKLRPRSKSSKSTKPSISTSSTSATHNHDSKTQEVSVDETAIEEGEVEREEGDDGKDYQEFLEKARKEAERKEKELLRSIMKKRETNLSPWAGRM